METATKLVCSRNSEERSKVARDACTWVLEGWGETESYQQGNWIREETESLGRREGGKMRGEWKEPYTNLPLSSRIRRDQIDSALIWKSVIIFERKNRSLPFFYEKASRIHRFFQVYASPTLPRDVFLTV